MPKSYECIFHALSENPQAGMIEGSTAFACIHRFPDYIPYTPELYDCADGCEFFCSKEMQKISALIEQRKQDGAGDGELKELQREYEHIKNKGRL